MGIAVKDAVGEDAFAHRGDDRLDHPLGLGRAGLELAHRLALEEVHGEDGAARELGVRHRRHHPVLGIEEAPDRQEVRELAGEVQLLEEALLELGDDGGGLKEAHLLDARLEGLGCEVEEIEVAAHLLGDARALHLEDEVRALFAVFAEAHGAVGLTDGGGGQGHRIDAREHLLDGATEALFDGPLHVLVGDLWGPILELHQRADPLVGQQIRAHGEHLAELDVGGTELREEAGEALGLGALDRLLRTRGEEGRGEGDAGEHLAETVPPHDGEHLAEALHVAHRHAEDRVCGCSGRRRGAPGERLRHGAAWPRCARARSGPWGSSR